MSVTLNNKKVLVTRPRQQADQLCELISNAGGSSLRFPTIEIQAVIDSEKLTNCFAKINKYDYVIFVSRNAVQVVFENYLNASDLATQIRLLAIGAGTKASLVEMNMTDVLHAGAEADSESLLLLKELQSEFIKGKRILIVRGVGGRELLADKLKSRAAVVDYAEVYERCLPEYKIQERHGLWQNDKIDVIVVSSNEGLENLLRLTQEEDKQQLFKTPLAVMSERNADLARDLGFISELGIAKAKSDAGLLSAVLELVGD